MVEADLGWAIIPNYIEINTNNNWVITLPTADFSLKEFFLIYRTDYSTIPWFKNLISEIKYCFKNNL